MTLRSGARVCASATDALARMLPMRSAPTPGWRLPHEPAGTLLAPAALATVGRGVRTVREQAARSIADAPAQTRGVLKFGILVVGVRPSRFVSSAEHHRKFFVGRSAATIGLTKMSPPSRAPLLFADIDRPRAQGPRSSRPMAI